MKTRFGMVNHYDDVSEKNIWFLPNYLNFFYPLNQEMLLNLQGRLFLYINSTCTIISRNAKITGYDNCQGDVRTPTVLQKSSTSGIR